MSWTYKLKRVGDKIKVTDPLEDRNASLWNEIKVTDPVEDRNASLQGWKNLKSGADNHLVSTMLPQRRGFGRRGGNHKRMRWGEIFRPGGKGVMDVKNKKSR